VHPQVVPGRRGQGTGLGGDGLGGQGHRVPQL
jgi:hypothetical protein